jgi:hypothetical protein
MALRASGFWTGTSTEEEAENIFISCWTMAAMLDRVFGNRLNLF